MKNSALFLLLAIISLACTLTDDEFGGFKRADIEFLLAGTGGSEGKVWIRQWRLEDNQQVEINCDSANRMRIRNIITPANATDSVIFRPLADDCELDLRVRARGTWRLYPITTVVSTPIDSIYLFFPFDTLKASIELITPSRLQISYDLVSEDATKKVVDYYEVLPKRSFVKPI